MTAPSKNPRPGQEVLNQTSLRINDKGERKRALFAAVERLTRSRPISRQAVSPSEETRITGKRRQSLRKWRPIPAQELYEHESRKPIVAGRTKSLAGGRPGDKGACGSMAAVSDWPRVGDGRLQICPCGPSTPGTAPSAELARLCTSSTKLRAANIPVLCNQRRMWCLRVVVYTVMLDLSLKTCPRFSRQLARPGTVVEQVNSQAWHACTIGWLYWLLVARHSQRPQQVCETVAVNATHVMCPKGQPTGRAHYS